MDRSHLDLPDHGLKTKHGPGGAQVFDPVRRRWVALTPEEWVRQHFINFLVNDRGCPRALLAVERTLRLHGLTRRADIVVHDQAGSPVALVECKAPDVRLTQAVFDQAARYNRAFRVRWLLVTNGRAHYCCEVDHAGNAVRFVDHIPDHAGLCGDPPP